jgi:chromosome segregation ATPase
LERGYPSIKKERDDLQSQVDKVKGELHAANAMVSSARLERQATNSQQSSSLYQQRQSFGKRKDMEERMDRMQAEADNLRGEIRCKGVVCIVVCYMMYP